MQKITVKTKIGIGIRWIIRKKYFIIFILTLVFKIEFIEGPAFSGLVLDVNLFGEDILTASKKLQESCIKIPIYSLIPVFSFIFIGLLRENSNFHTLIKKIPTF